MQTLFAISVLCFVGILWAALAFARRIKASQLHSRSDVPSHPDFKYHLYSAPATLPQILPETVSAPAATARITRQTVLQQSVHDITANKQWTLPPQAIHMHRFPIRAVESAQSVSATTRKPPQPARHGRMALLDPAFFNKDMGDLTDPQPDRLRANDRVRSNSSKRY